MKIVDQGWWRGFVFGGAISWIVAAGLLALYARGTAMIPSTGPLHEQFTNDANRIALRIFCVVAVPGFLALLVATVLNKTRKF